jgi:hypothetical protein
MYLGGPAKQALVELPEDLHVAYHAGLDRLLPRWRSADYWRSLSPEEQARNFDLLRLYTEQFDAKHGTKLWEAIKRTAAGL